MAKSVLNTLEGLPEALQAEYEVGEGGKFFLKVEGIEEHPSTAPLKRAKDHEKTARQKAEALAAESRAQLEALTIEKEELLKGVVPKDNITALETSWAARMEKQRTDLTAQISALDSSLKRAKISDVASTAAAQIAVDAEAAPILARYMADRLSVEIVDGEARTRVLDEDLKPSASTLEDLKKEFSGKKMFAHLILGSKASGGSAKGSQGGGSAPQTPGPNSTPKEWAAWAKEKAKSKGG